MQAIATVPSSTVTIDEAIATVPSSTVAIDEAIATVTCNQPRYQGITCHGSALNRGICSIATGSVATVEPWQMAEFNRGNRPFL